MYARSYSHTQFVSLFCTIQCINTICMKVYIIKKKIHAHTCTHSYSHSFHIYCPRWISEFNRFELFIMFILWSEMGKNEKDDRLWDWKSFEMTATTKCSTTHTILFRLSIPDAIITQSVSTIIAIHSHHKIYHRTANVYVNDIFFSLSSVVEWICGLHENLINAI